MYIDAHEWLRASAEICEIERGNYSSSPGFKPPLAGHSGESAKFYSRLAHAQPDMPGRTEAAAFLRHQLAKVADKPCELPESPQDLGTWMHRSAQLARLQYSAYLKERQAGCPRRYFSNRAHALYFLRTVAPTKLVDGAWLYGLLAHANHPRFSNLVRTYVEELGDGQPDKNHVLLYRELMSRYGLDLAGELDDQFYVQGLIQLALGCNTPDFLPELIGFNLGYEQLPLHLLITAHELDELGLDAYYFTLHITVDNADTGHARRAVQAALEMQPSLVNKGDHTADYWRRLRLGFQLGDAGEGTTDVINGFDIEREVVRILSRKSAVGHGAHSDYCRVAGRSVNDWLAEPAQIPAFLAELQRTGWIKRGAAVAESRFWGLLQGNRAEMFGVFSSYELQVIHDWMRGSASTDGQDYAQPGVLPGSFRATARRATARREGLHQGLQACALPDPDLQALHQQLALRDANQQEALLVELMAPSQHWSPAGLEATRLFCKRYV